MAPQPSVSIVVPIHNEADFLGVALEEMLTALHDVPADAVVLLVENGSTDATADVARRMATTSDRVTVLSLPAADYGEALYSGFRRAGGDWIVNFDIDYFSGDFVTRALAIGADADIVIASKRAPGSDDRRSWFRRLATGTFNLLLRWVLGSSLTDTHGIKAFRRQAIAPLIEQVTSRQDLFDTELVLRAERAGARIVEVPVVVEELRQARSSLVKRVPRTLQGVFRMRRTFAAEAAAGDQHGSRSR